MSTEQWQAIKTADRLEADREFRADPANASNFLATWGRFPGDAIDFDDSGSFMAPGELPWSGDCPYPVDWE